MEEKLREIKEVTNEMFREAVSQGEVLDIFNLDTTEIKALCYMSNMAKNVFDFEEKKCMKIEGILERLTTLESNMKIVTAEQNHILKGIDRIIEHVQSIEKKLNKEA